jgi:hypothetical protein
MKIYILSAYEENSSNFAFKIIQKTSKIDTFKKYKLENNPQLADIIIFVEHHPGFDPYFFNVLKHPIYKRYKNKCYLYHDNDQHISIIPTISPSISTKHFNKKLHHPFQYIAQISNNIHIDNFVKKIDERKYLYSFIGTSRTSPLRISILEQNKDDIYLLDTLQINSWDLNPEERNKYFLNYAEISSQSKFILCPRGVGPSSYRLFESMKMGIAPVIISDEWVEPIGIDWKSCSIRIKEKDIFKIYEIVKNRENDFLELGINAKKIYENFFSSEKQFHLLSLAANNLHSYRKQISFFDYLYEYLRFLESFHLRNLLRYFKNKILK